MQSHLIRKTFLDFFKEKDHKIVPSAPIVVKDDPTLMFTNAGMNQFKDFFLGNREPDHPRISDTQKCLRVSGKHNDLEVVGYDSYHHTMFEMLGNWSFGDYFKKEAIEWAWELLTEKFGLPEERIYATVFEGDKDDGLDWDKEAYDIWKQILPEDRILKAPKSENFWEMGDTGPCGPCSEIHIDLRPDEEVKKKPGAELVNMDDPQVMEIWNLVFMEFNRKADKSLEPLPAKHVDTGMGFERLVRILQNKDSNYDTDLFQPVIEAIEQKFSIKYGSNEENDVAIRVLSDHIRAVTCTIADGEMPSNTGAGYVIRRILRRAVRYGYRYFNARSPFFNELVPVLATIFKDVFPEIHKQQDFIQKIVKEEESTFLKTLDTGTRLFEQYVAKSSDNVIDGTFAFQLYDTYGFPIDLTRLMAREKNYEVDEKGFEKELDKQKKRSRKDAEKELGDWNELGEFHATRFTGYDNTSDEMRLMRWREENQKGKTQYHLVFDQTPFYAESGGQVGDTGYLQNEQGEKIRVLDTVSENELIIHICAELPENKSSVFKGVVDENKRRLTAANHTATHLMHAALREVLGDHVMQKGSLVNESYLRFDFSHFKKLEQEEIEQVEAIVNKKIRENVPRKEEREVPFNEALNKGAVALFGEKYGDSVRMITFDPGFSVELCGGTHVQSTGNIGFFKIAEESAIAAGVRRIQAVTGPEAEKFVKEQQKSITEIKELLKNPKKPAEAVKKLQQDLKSLQEQLEEFKQKQVSTLQSQLAEKTELLDEKTELISEKVDLASPEQGKMLTFSLNKKDKQTIVLLGAAFGEKTNLWLMIPESLTGKTGLNANEIIKDAATEIKGGGGGQAFFATAGGKEPQNLNNALEKAKKLIKEKLS